VLQFPQQVKAAGWNVLRAIWRSLPQAVRNVIRPM
jgi:predicted transcriptional regulator